MDMGKDVDILFSVVRDTLDNTLELYCSTSFYGQTQTIRKAPNASVSRIDETKLN